MPALVDQATDAQRQQLSTMLNAYADTFEDRSAALLASVESTQTQLQADAVQRNAVLAETTAASQQQLAAALAGQFDGVTARLDQAVSQVAETFDERTRTLLTSIDASHTAFALTTQTQQAALTQQVADQLDGIARCFDGVVHTVSETWTSALAKHEHASDRLTQTLDQTQTSLAAKQGGTGRAYDGDAQRDHPACTAQAHGHDRKSLKSQVHANGLHEYPFHIERTVTIARHALPAAAAPADGPRGARC